MREGPIDDADLIALADGELEKSLADAMMQRIATDAVLRARYETLLKEREALSAAFEALLPQAPLARLKAFIPPDAPPRRTLRFRALALRDLAAGLMIGFALAAAILMFGLRGDKAEDDWRSAVVNYMALYTHETFAQIPENADARAAELAAVGARVGARLTPEAVALPGLDLRTAFILAYDDKPLGEVVQTDRAGAPVLFCVIANARADAPLKSQRRDGFSLASWSRGGKGYLVIADLPQAQVEAYAKTLETRF